MELRHIRAFVAVAEERNFTRAAVRVFLSQPAFTRVIQRLEGELGTRLLERTSRVVTLTDAGRTFLKRAHNVLAELELAAAELKTHAGEVRLRVGFPQYATYGLIPEVLARFADVSPGVGVEQHELFSEQQLPKLLTGELDIGFMRTPQQQPQIEYLPFVTEEIWAMLPEDHPLTAQLELRLIDLQHERLLLPSRMLSARFHDYMVACCRQAGFIPDVLTMEGSVMYSHSTNARLVASRAAVTVVYAPLARASRERVAFRRICEPKLHMELVVAWKRGTSSPAMQQFVQLTQQLAQEHAAKKA